MLYEKYKNARNLTWRLIIDCGICELPVKVSSICKMIGIEIKAYSKNKEFVDYFLKDKERDGFAIEINNKPIIFFNDECTIGRQRFTAAHELGHILLSHTGYCDLENHEIKEDDKETEIQANIFASRLLAPACVLKECGVKNSMEIENLCNISHTAAEFRMKRLNELYKRDEEFLKTRGKGCFYLSPLELKIKEQFTEYIAKNKIR